MHSRRLSIRVRVFNQAVDKAQDAPLGLFNQSVEEMAADGSQGLEGEANDDAKRS